MQTNAVSGRFFIWAIAAAGIAVLPFLPIRLRAEATLTPYGGNGVFTVRALCCPLTVWLCLRFLERPAFSMDILRRDGAVRKRTAFRKGGKPSPLPRLLKGALRVGRLELDWIIGVPDDPALTVLLCGAAASVLRETLMLLLPKADVRVAASPVFTVGACRLTLTCIASVRLVDIIREIYTIRGE